MPYTLDMQTIAQLLVIARAAKGRVHFTTGPSVPWIKPSDIVLGSNEAANFAQAMGIATVRLEAFESGKALPTVGEARRIAQVYGMDADLFIARIERERATCAANLIRLVALLSEARQRAMREKEKAEARWNVMRFST